MKVSIQYITIFGWFITLFLGCGPLIKGGVFNRQPTTIRSGSLLGPFEGQVVDSDTEVAIPGAIVWASWAFVRGIGDQAPEGVRTFSTRTSADGRYQIPALKDLPSGFSTRLAKLSIIIYKKGYVAYRHDQIFNQKRSSTNFFQLDNFVKLSRWSPDLSHAKHLLFLGNAEPLVKASRWEIDAAVAELSGELPRHRTSAGMRPMAELAGKPGIPPVKRQTLNASVLLSSDEVRVITGYTGQFQPGRLTDPSSESFDSYHLRAVDKPERYDIAIRLWRLTGEALEKKYEETLESLPDSKQTDEVANRSFIVSQGEILGLGFMERAHSALVLVTCGKGQCSKTDHLLRLAKKIEENLEKLPSFSEGETPTSAPSEENPQLLPPDFSTHDED